VPASPGGRREEGLQFPPSLFGACARIFRSASAPETLAGAGRGGVAADDYRTITNSSILQPSAPCPGGQKRLLIKVRCTVKKLVSIGVVLVLTSPAALAIGEEFSVSQPPAVLYALSKLPAAERTELTPINDVQLAAIEGASQLQLLIKLLKQAKGVSVNFRRIVREIQAQNGSAVSVVQVTQSNPPSGGGAVNVAQITQRIN
jgi:hypothetical protein